MNYTQKLTLSMVIPTVMVAGAGTSVVLGALWLQGQAKTVTAETMAGYLQWGGSMTAVLTAICVAVCIGFTIWIRRTASAVRRLGMGAVQRMPALKNFFMNEARGTSGKLPRLLQSA